MGTFLSNRELDFCLESFFRFAEGKRKRGRERERERERERQGENKMEQDKMVQ